MNRESLTSEAIAVGELPPSPAKVAYLEYLEGFRGLAIIFVVMIHANNALLQRGVERIEGEFSAVWTFFHIISHNSTVYFALISGILYAYHLHRKPHGMFLRTRVESVVVPYVLVSGALTLLTTGMATLRGNDAAGAGALAEKILWNIVTGEAWNHLWYIPVITVLYIISPVLLRVVQDRRFGVPIALAFILVPLIVSRTQTDVTPSMLIYFAGVYVVGLVIGRDPEKTLGQLEHHISIIASIALLSAIAVWFLDMYAVEFVGPTSVRESGIYLLRISLAILMLIGLRRFSAGLGPLTNRALNQIATYSFGIYFLHAPLLRPIVKVLGWLVPEGNPAWALALAVLVTFVVSLVSTALIVFAIKSLTGDRSKFLIGS